MKVYQLNIFNEKEEVKKISCTDYESFCKKFETKKTTDDCFTPPAVFEAVKNYIHENICNLDKYEVLRPFWPGKDYLKENYKENSIVIDNPPFSIYSKIVKNYLEMNVKFFLFAPALTLFIYNMQVNYIITNSNVVYENGARVRTSFCTNLDCGGRVVLDGVLSERIKEAQKSDAAPEKITKPAGIYSSADLLKFVTRGAVLRLEASENYIKKIGNKKIFGLGLQFTDSDTEKLLNIKNNE